MTLERRKLWAWIVSLLPLLAYSAGVAIGFIHLLRLPPPVAGKLIAARDLPAGHRIVAGDIEVPVEPQVQAVVEGKYLTVRVKPKEAIDPHRLATRPHFKAATGKVVYFAPLSNHKHLRPYLDVGSHLGLCWDDARCIADVPVLGIVCEPDKECAAVIEIEPQQLAVTGRSEALRLSLR